MVLYSTIPTSATPRCDSSCCQHVSQRTKRLSYDDQCSAVGPSVINGAKMSDTSPAPGSSSPSSSPRRPLHARQSSQHAPLTPSRLRESLIQSPVDKMAKLPSREAERERQYSPLSSPPLQPQPDEPLTAAGDDQEEDSGLIQGDIIEPSQAESNARTRLLEDYHRGAVCGSRNCNHGTFSPRLRSSQNSISSGQDQGGRYGGGDGEDGGAAHQSNRPLGDSIADTIFGGSRRDKRMSTTQWLAFKHGIKNQRLLSVLTIRLQTR